MHRQNLPVFAPFYCPHNLRQRRKKIICGMAVLPVGSRGVSSFLRVPRKRTGADDLFGNHPTARRGDAVRLRRQQNPMTVMAEIVAALNGNHGVALDSRRAIRMIKARSGWGDSDFQHVTRGYPRRRDRVMNCRLKIPFSLLTTCAAAARSAHSL